MTTDKTEKLPNFTLRRAIVGAALVVLTVAGYLLTPSGRQAMDPGPTYDLTESSVLPDAYTHSDGQIMGLTVLATPLNRFSAAWNQLFVHKPTISAAGGVDGASYTEQALASRQAAINSAMALYMGTDEAVLTVTASQDGDVRVGDRLLAIDGEPATAMTPGTWLLARGSAPYDIVSVADVQPDDVEVSVSQAGTFDGMHPIDPDSKAAFYGEGFPLQDDVGGPSMGLALTLAWLNALRTDIDLTSGDTIAATGTVGSNGKVGPVAGVKVKLREAAATDVDLVLIPASYDGSVPEGVTVKKVRTVKEAYMYLLKRAA